ncbi:TPA: hypothetical protein G8O14_004795 [Salmonella enterica]|nr:hypothetical protein [Salmonella enterica]
MAGCNAAVTPHGCASVRFFWLVVLSVILHRVEYSGVFSSGWVCSLVVGVVFGLCVPLVGYVAFLPCHDMYYPVIHSYLKRVNSMNTLRKLFTQLFTP